MKIAVMGYSGSGKSTLARKLSEKTGVWLKAVYGEGLETPTDDDGDYIETPDYRLELDDLVLSDILLELPLKYLCSDDCKGLCERCGKNLNEGECDCKGKEIDPRLAVLQKWVDKSEN